MVIAVPDEGSYIMVPAAAFPAGSMPGIKRLDRRVIRAVARATGSRRPGLIFKPLRVVLKPLATFLPPGRDPIPLNEDCNSLTYLGNSAINERYLHTCIYPPNVVVYATPALGF